MMQMFFRRYLVVLAVAMLLITPFLPMLTSGRDTVGSNVERTREDSYRTDYISGQGSDLTISSDYTVSGFETWNNVTVTSTGKLVVPSDSTFNVTRVYLQSGSIVEIEGGDLILSDPDPSSNISFQGDCDLLNITSGSEVHLRGSDGYADTSTTGPYTSFISTSQGGDAVFNVTVSEGVKFIDSNISVQGGDGFDLPSSTASECNAWVQDMTLDNYTAAGGYASFHIELESQDSSVSIQNTTVNVTGGNGGKAADGGSTTYDNNNGLGGGYSNGGLVSGKVGIGGNSSIDIDSSDGIKISNSSISSTGGRGGEAGKGGTAKVYSYSGGGGGYAGGNGIGGNGVVEDAIVKGDVGKGGLTNIIFNSTFMELNSSELTFRGGNGGKGGEGGLCRETSLYYSGGGGGGGGYAGGGGSGGTDGGKAGDGFVYDRVGSGGNLSVLFDIDDVNVDGSSMFMKGGTGGEAGDGGDRRKAANGGAGGGGYGGGGGGTDAMQYAPGGNGTVEDSVGSGGTVNVTFDSERFNLIGSRLNISGGDGGEAGDGGLGKKESNHGDYQPGGGGGGYGGGGAGSDPGHGIVNGSVGTGGECSFTIKSTSFKVFSSNLSVKGGTGGNGGEGATGTNVVGGGGGYGGGSHCDGEHGQGILIGDQMGDGGNCTVNITSDDFRISCDSSFNFTGGKGGYAPTSPGDGQFGGEGTGRDTDAGSLSQSIPMSVPILKSPENNLYAYKKPNFEWCAYENSTKGELSNYTIMIDDQIDFSSPEIVNTTNKTSFTPYTSLSNNTYHWKVKATYSDPPGSTAGWSDIWNFMIENVTPSADAGPNKSVYENISLTLDGSNSSDNVGIENYTWTVMGEEFYDKEINYTFKSNGTYDAKLEVTDICGNNDTDNCTITVLHDSVLPTADAGPNQSVYENVSLILDGSNSSDNVGINNYTWIIKGGYYYGETVQHTFNTSGTYNVTLEVTDYSGNKDTDNCTITVMQDDVPPSADAGPDKTVDEDIYVKFNGSNSSDNVGITNYTWIINGTYLHGEEVQYNFTQPDSYIVTLNVSDDAGNYNADTCNVTVNDTTRPDADAGPDKTVDEDTIVTFNGSNSSDNGGIANYTWTIQGTELYGEVVQYNFTEPGSYIVTLNVTDQGGNQDSDICNVTVNDTTSPVADSGPDKTVNEDVPITFNGSNSSDNVAITNYTWLIDGTYHHGEEIQHTFNQPGSYNVTLYVRDDAGHSDTDTCNITVSDTTSPIADAGPDKTVNEDVPITFNGSNSSDNVAITDYTWLIDGTYHHGDEVQYTFNQPGSYNVILNVTDDAGNYDTDTCKVTVNDTTPPDANAGPDKTVDEDTIVTFNGSGSSDAGGINNYTWVIEGTELYGEEVQYTFMEPGSYVVTLNVTDSGGNHDRDRCNVTVTDTTSPEVDAGPDKTVDEDTIVTFNGSGSSDNVGIINYTWSIEGTYLYGEEVQYNFAQPGSYVVTLNVTDDASNHGTDTCNVTVTDTTLPDAEAGEDQTVEAGTSVTLDGSNSTDNVAITNYTWTVQNTDIYGEEVQHSFTDLGTYIVTLNVADEAGNHDTDICNITVIDSTPPTANAGEDQTVALGEEFTLSGEGSSDNVEIVNYTWTHDGAEYYSIEVTHSFSQVGTYEFTLEVSDAEGNQDSDTVIITVEDRTEPIAEAKADRTTVNVGESIQFDASESSDNGNITSYAWDFDDGERGSGITVAHSYESKGNYTVTLTVRDGAGNTGTDTVIITVEKEESQKDDEPPEADAGEDQIVKVREDFTLDGSGSSDNVGIVNHTWTIEGESYFGVEVTHNFSVEGVYNITLRVRDRAGNTDSDTVKITVDQDTDGDGMPDEWEERYGLDPNDPKDADKDKDGDGYTNKEEYERNTDPTKAESTDEKSGEKGLGLWIYLLPIVIVVIILALVAWKFTGKETEPYETGLDDHGEENEIMDEETNVEGPEEDIEEEETIEEDENSTLEEF